jgi:hypothetical protein
MWVLHDFAKPGVLGGKTFSSERSYNQYFYTEKVEQTLQITLFSGKMLTGQAVITDTKPTGKDFVAPGTVGNTMLNFACK